MSLPAWVGTPSIREAPEVRIAHSPGSGLISVWVAGTGYLRTDEIDDLARILATRPRSPSDARTGSGDLDCPATALARYVLDMREAVEDGREMPCPAAGGLLCGSDECRANGCEEQR